MYKEAIQDLNYSISLDKNVDITYLNRALANFELKNYKESIEDYSKSIKLNPYYTNAYCGRGIVNLQL
jgi:tetratricopeptide (TPR) repeat protein